MIQQPKWGRPALSDRYTIEIDCVMIAFLYVDIIMINLSLPVTVVQILAESLVLRERRLERARPVAEKQSWVVSA